MGKQPTLTLHDCDVITAHNNIMIDAARAILAKYRQVAISERSDYVAGQMEYARNCVSAYKWSSSVARQQSEANHNAKRHKPSAPKTSFEGGSGDRTSESNGGQGQAS